MRRFLAVLLVLAASAPLALAPAALAGGRHKAPPRMDLKLAQDPPKAAVGDEFQLSVQVVHPEGIKLNRYPGITLEIAKAPGIALASKTAFVGSKKPITDPAKFGFHEIPPLVLRGKVQKGRKGTRYLEGTLKFFYCVKKSGYCAPGEQKVRLPLYVR